MGKMTNSFLCCPGVDSGQETTTGVIVDRLDGSFIGLGFYPHLCSVMDRLKNRYYRRWIWGKVLESLAVGCY